MSDTRLDRLNRDSGATFTANVFAGGDLRVYCYNFTFDTPNLLTGAVAYTPTIGDILMNAWFEINIAWNGTTPLGDMGTSSTIAGGNSWFGDTRSNGSVKMDSPDDDRLGILAMFNGGAGYASDLVSAGLFDAGAPDHDFLRLAPSKFISEDPICVIVTDDGSINGNDPGSTQGAAKLYLAIIKPEQLN